MGSGARSTRGNGRKATRHEGPVPGRESAQETDGSGKRCFFFGERSKTKEVWRQEISGTREEGFPRTRFRSYVEKTLDYEKMDSKQRGGRESRRLYFPLQGVTQATLVRVFADATQS